MSIRQPSNLRTTTCFSSSCWSAEIKRSNHRMGRTGATVISGGSNNL
jgi:hypothetical protein